jgi:hypothetical protein
VDAFLNALTFEWDAGAPGFLADVRVESSEDLRSWSTWGREAVLARLTFGGDLLERNEIALPPRRVRYVRVSWTSGDAPPVPVRVSATPATQPGEPEAVWSVAEATRTDDAVHFATGGFFPVEQIRVLLPEMNTLARAVIESSASEDGPWTTRFDGLIYRLDVDGREVASAPARFASTSDSYWRLRVDPAGGGVGRQSPRLEFGWVPERLLFVARGNGPFMLAFGAAGIAPSRFHAAELLRLEGPEPLSLSSERLAATGPAFDRGGAARLQPVREILWSHWLLWGVLVLGVALLAVFALRLIRQNAAHA